MFPNKFTSFQEEIKKQLEDKIKILENKVEIMDTRLHAMEIQKTPEQGETNTVEHIKLKDRIKELEGKVNHNLTLNNIECKIDIKPIKEEMNKLIALDHDCNKGYLNLVIFGLKEDAKEDTLSIVKTKLHNRLQIETISLIEGNRLRIKKG